MSNSKGHANRLMGSSVLVFISVFIVALFGYFTRLFLSRALSLEEYGLFYALISFVLFFAFFRDLGLNSALTKYVSEFRAKNRNKEIKSSFAFVLSIDLIISFVIAILIFIFSDSIAISFFHSAAASYLLKIFSIMIFADSIVYFSKAFLQGMQEMTYYSIVQPLTVIISFFGVFFMINFGINGAAIGYVLGYIIMAIISLIICFRVLPFFKIKSWLNKNISKTLLLFATTILVGNIGTLIITATDTMIITYFRPLSDVAYYQVAIPTIQILWMFATTITIVLYPFVSDMFSRGMKKMVSQGVSLSLKLSLIIILPLVMIIIAFSEFVIKLLFGEAFLPAVSVLQILSISAIFYTLWLIASTALVGIGKPKISTKIILIVAAFNLIGNIIAVQLFGIIGVAVVTLISFVMAFLLTYMVLRKYVIISFSIKHFVSAVIGGLIMLGIIFMIKTMLSLNPWIEVVLGLVVGLIFYMVFILYTKTISKNELKILLSIKIPIPKFLIRLAEKLVSD